MPRPLTTRPLPLRKFREEKGMTLPEAAEKLSLVMGRTIKPEYVSLLEHRGTPLFDWVEAFAEIYDKPITEVGAAARRKNKYQKVSKLLDRFISL